MDAMSLVNELKLAYRKNQEVEKEAEKEREKKQADEIILARTKQYLKGTLPGNLHFLLDFLENPQSTRAGSQDEYVAYTLSIPGHYQVRFCPQTSPVKWFVGEESTEYTDPGEALTAAEIPL